MAAMENQQSKSSSNGEHKACVSPSPSYGIMALLLDALEKVVVWMFYTSSKKPPLRFLSDNFAPVSHETHPQPNLPVHGTIPSCMNGEFFRVGPNPKHPPVAGYHWFDGDGMIHGLRIKDGKATYVSRYVKTSRLQQEDYFGAAKFLKLGDLKGFFGLFMAQIMSLRVRFGVVDTSQGSGTGNTALAYHDGRLLALHEGDKPYALRILEDGDLQTIGLLDYEKRLNHPFTAHPKLDPKTGELFTFGYQFEPPYCTYHVISKDGIMQDPVTITVSGPVMMHDFAITENYAIFMDLPLYFLPREMVKGGYILKFDASKKARFGILPRYAKNESLIKWFELPSCYIFHNANAWEEGDEVVLFSCRVPDVDLETASGLVKEKIKTFQNELYKLRFNLVTGSSSQKRISASAVDFPRINENYIGSKQQFAYCTVLDQEVKVKGLAKFDLSAEPNLVGKKEIEVGGNVRGVILFGPGRYGSEAIFVPETSELHINEDDGYLICFSYDENSSKSEVLIFDAKTMSSEPVATISLPSRVPYGFHAFFINEEGLLSQKEGFAG